MATFRLASPSPGRNPWRDRAVAVATLNLLPSRLGMGEPVSRRPIWQGPRRSALWLAGTALDGVGPCVEAFGMNIREGAPAGEVRPRTPRSCRRTISPGRFSLARFVLMVCQPLCVSREPASGISELFNSVVRIRSCQRAIQAVESVCHGDAVKSFAEELAGIAIDEGRRVGALLNGDGAALPVHGVGHV